MIFQIVFMAFLVISSAAESDQEIEKARTWDPLGYIDGLCRIIGYTKFFVFTAAIAVLSFSILGDRLRRVEYRRNHQIEPYQEDYNSKDRNLKNRFKRFAKNGKVLSTFSYLRLLVKMGYNLDQT